jgi:replicative DNA helicase
MGEPLRALPNSRRPLHNPEAEEAVIGGVLFVGRKAFVRVADLLEPKDFSDPKHQAIYSAAIALDQEDRPIDLLTMADKLQQAGALGYLGPVGGVAYLAELSNRIGTVENIEEHARMVRERAVRRQLALAGEQIKQLAYGDDANVLDQAQQIVFDVQQRGERKSYRPVGEIVRQAVIALDERYKQKRAITGVPTGYTLFDEMTAGLQPADLILLAARPSMGKTTLAVNVAKEAASAHGVPALIFSLEMPSQRLRNGRLSAQDWINITRAASGLAPLRIAIDDTGALRMQELRARARRWRTDPRFWTPGTELGLIVVDYLQLIDGGGTRSQDESRTQEVSGVSRGLKALAKELGVPVLALSQLNRNVEYRADPRPKLADLRESGSLEQDADLICFISPDSDDPNIAELSIGKQRNGPTGIVRLLFRKELTRFENLDEAHA